MREVPDCTRCEVNGAFGDGELCTRCLMDVRMYVAKGIRELLAYLAKVDAFRAWCDEHQMPA